MSAEGAQYLCCVRHRVKDVMYRANTFFQRNTVVVVEATGANSGIEIGVCEYTHPCYDPSETEGLTDVNRPAEHHEIQRYLTQIPKESQSVLNFLRQINDIDVPGTIVSKLNFVTVEVQYDFSKITIYYTQKDSRGPNLGSLQSYLGNRYKGKTLVFQVLSHEEAATFMTSDREKNLNAVLTRALSTVKPLPTSAFPEGSSHTPPSAAGAANSHGAPGSTAGSTTTMPLLPLGLDSGNTSTTSMPAGLASTGNTPAKSTSSPLLPSSLHDDFFGNFSSAMSGANKSTPSTTAATAGFSTFDDDMWGVTGSHLLRDVMDEDDDIVEETKNSQGSSSASPPRTAAARAPIEEDDDEAFAALLAKTVEDDDDDGDEDRDESDSHYICFVHRGVNEGIYHCRKFFATGVPVIVRLKEAGLDNARDLGTVVNCFKADPKENSHVEAFEKVSGVVERIASAKDVEKYFSLHPESREVVRYINESMMGQERFGSLSDMVIVDTHACFDRNFITISYYERKNKEVTFFGPTPYVVQELESKFNFKKVIFRRVSELEIPKSRPIRPSTADEARKLEIKFPYLCCVQHRVRVLAYRSKQSFEAGQPVIVDGDGGNDLGYIACCILVDPATNPIAADYMISMRNVQRLADPQSAISYQMLQAESESALEYIRSLTNEQVGTNIQEMNIVDVEFQVDRAKLTVFYTDKANVTVRHQNISKLLFGVYKCRIWFHRLTPARALAHKVIYENASSSANAGYQNFDINALYDPSAAAAAPWMAMMFQQSMMGGWGQMGMDPAAMQMQLQMMMQSGFPMPGFDPMAAMYQQQYQMPMGPPPMQQQPLQQQQQPRQPSPVQTPPQPPESAPDTPPKDPLPERSPVQSGYNPETGEYHPPSSFTVTSTDNEPGPSLRPGARNFTSDGSHSHTMVFPSPTFGWNPNGPPPPPPPRVDDDYDDDGGPSKRRRPPMTPAHAKIIRKMNPNSHPNGLPAHAQPGVLQFQQQQQQHQQYQLQLSQNGEASSFVPKPTATPWEPSGANSTVVPSGKPQFVILVCLRSGAGKYKSHAAYEVGCPIVVEGDGGYELGVVSQCSPINNNERQAPKLVKREANAADVSTYATLLQQAIEVLAYIKSLRDEDVGTRVSAMPIVDCEFQLDVSKLTIFHEACDVRHAPISKHLFALYRCRIWFQRIPDADKFKERCSYRIHELNESFKKHLQCELPADCLPAVPIDSDAAADYLTSEVSPERGNAHVAVKANGSGHTNNSTTSPMNSSTSFQVTSTPPAAGRPTYNGPNVNAAPFFVSGSSEAHVDPIDIAPSMRRQPPKWKQQPPPSPDTSASAHDDSFMPAQPMLPPPAAGSVWGDKAATAPPVTTTKPKTNWVLSADAPVFTSKMAPPPAATTTPPAQPVEQRPKVDETSAVLSIWNTTPDTADAFMPFKITDDTMPRYNGATAPTGVEKAITPPEAHITPAAVDAPQEPTQIVTRKEPRRKNLPKGVAESTKPAQPPASVTDLLRKLGINAKSDTGASKPAPKPAAVLPEPEYSSGSSDDDRNGDSERRRTKTRRGRRANAAKKFAGGHKHPES